MRLLLKFFFSVFLGMSSFLTAADAFGAVKTYPAPEGQAVEGVYRVLVDGQNVDVYSALDQEEGSGEYYFASFDFSDSVEIEISSQFSLEKTQVAPERFGVATVRKNEKTLTLKADKPFQISVEPNGRAKPLILFGNAFEKDAPKEGDENVIYFGPGVHNAGRVDVTSGQTVYLAAGAVVKGAIRVQGENITICGRGILAGEDSPRFQGPSAYMIHCVDSKNVVVRDVVARNPWSWTFVTNNCDGVTIDGVKICGSRMINDDALDLCNTRNVLVKDCFFRTQDDSVAIKGLMETPSPACENISVEDCVFWTDRANIFRVGYECQADAMQNISAKNIDVLYYSVNYREPAHYWANAIVWLQPNQEMTMQNCRFENFRIRSNGDDMILLEARPMSCSYGDYKEPTPGRLADCSFENWTVYGERGNFAGVINIRGVSENSNVKNLKFRNVSYFGQAIEKESECVQIGDFVDGVSFISK